MFNEKINEIYDSIKRSARGNWRYDPSTLTLVIHLDDQNITKVKIPNRDIGDFLAQAPNRIAWLLEAIYVHRDIAIQLLPKESQDEYVALVQGRLNPIEEGEKSEGQEIPA